MSGNLNENWLGLFTLFQLHLETAVQNMSGNGTFLLPALRMHVERLNLDEEQRVKFKLNE